VILLVGGGALWALRSGVGSRLGLPGAEPDVASVLALLPAADALPEGWTMPAVIDGEANPFVTSERAWLEKRIGAEGAKDALASGQVRYSGLGTNTGVWVVRLKDRVAADEFADLTAANGDPQQAPVLQNGRTVAVVGDVLEGPVGHNRHTRPLTSMIQSRLVAAGFVVGPPGVQARVAEKGRAVSANESSTIGDVRTVISAQAACQAANGGFYEGRFACLGSPADCIPDYPRNGPAFLRGEVAALTPRSGYVREFHPGPAAASRPPFTSASSVVAWAYTAVPVQQGETGVKSYCGDASGVVVLCDDGRRPPVRDGACVVSADECRILH
jgi:hypothetical protein